MVSRKSHPKSRNGCAQCKRRRIKCNEARPQCSNCLKHEIECDFATSPTKSEHSPKAKRQRSNETKSTGHSSVGQSPVLLNHEPGRLYGSGRNLQPLQMEDLEMFHHFITITCTTLSDRAESHRLWREVVPQLAFEHEFLMRGILAISALHLSTLRNDRHDYYLNLAVRQQDSALSQFRAAMATEMYESKGDAFFAMSTVIVVYGFESPKAADSLGMFNYNGEDSDEWLPLIRGVNSVIQSVWMTIKEGRLNGLLHDFNESPNSTNLPSILSEQMEYLDRYCDALGGSEEDIQACKDAAYHLRQCFIRMNNKTASECEVSLAFLWPVYIPQHFVHMLHQKRPEALIILSHYCVTLYHLDRYWWLNGWAQHIIHIIRQELHPDLHYWIQWPMNTVHLRTNFVTNGDLDNPIQGTRVSSDFDTAIDRQLAIPKKEIDDVQHDESSSSKFDNNNLNEGEFAKQTLALAS